MERVNFKMRGVIEELYKSREYREYKQMKKVIAANPKLRERIDAYRGECYAFQRRQENPNMETKDVLAETDRIEQAYADVLHNRDVMKYLNLEYELCGFIRRSYETLIRAVDLPLDGVLRNDE